MGKNEEDSSNFSKLSDPCRMQNQSQPTPPPLPSSSNLGPALVRAFPKHEKLFVYFSLRFVDFTFAPRGFCVRNEGLGSVHMVTELHDKYVWYPSARWHDERNVISNFGGSNHLVSITIFVTATVLTLVTNAETREMRCCQLCTLLRTFFTLWWKDIHTKWITWQHCFSGLCPSSGVLNTWKIRHWTFEFHEMLGNYRVA
jgi:hypothetical protein